jgi:hypothetical protein
MHGIERREHSNRSHLSSSVPVSAQMDSGRPGPQYGLRVLYLVIAAIPAPLLILSATWAMTIESALPASKGKHSGFHFTPLELQAATVMLAFVMAVYAVRTFYAHIRERRADDKAKNPLDHTEAAQNALAELSAFRSAVADTDRALTRLQEFRRDNQISPGRPVRLPRKAFAENSHLADNYQGLQHRLIGACGTTLGHVANIWELAPLAVTHAPDAFNDEVMNALVRAESLRRIMEDSDIPLEDAEKLVALISAATFPLLKDQPHDPNDSSGS